MKVVHEVKTVKALLGWRKAKMLSANPEYQRGEVWTPAQQKRLVDSVLRCYPIPLIYLHHIKTDVEGASPKYSRKSVLLVRELLSMALSAPFAPL